MTDSNDADELRRIAREEARAVYDDLAVDGPDGDEWTLPQLMERFQIDRRTALKALGLIGVGLSAPAAVIRAFSGTAEAASDDLTVPGTLDAGAITTDTIDIISKLNVPAGPAAIEREDDKRQKFGFSEIDSVADGATAEVLPGLSTSDKVCMLFVQTLGEVGLFALRGNVNEVSVVADPFGTYSATAGNAGTTNIYWSGSRYELENQTGGTLNYEFTVVYG